MQEGSDEAMKAKPQHVRDSFGQYANYLRSRFDIREVAEYKKLDDFISVHKLPRSVMYELRRRDLEKKKTHMRTLEQTIKTINQKRAQIVEWDLTKHMNNLTRVLKGFTKSGGAVNYIIDNTTNSLIINKHAEKKNYTYHLGTMFDIKSHNTLASYAAYKTDLIVTDDVNADPRFPLGVGWKESEAKAAMAVPVLKEGRVVAIIELTKTGDSLEYSFVDVLAASVLTSIIGVLAEDSEKHVEAQKSLAYISPMLSILNRFIAGTLPLQNIVSQIMFANKSLLRADSCSFGLVEEIRKRRFLIMYKEDEHNFSCHKETARIMDCESSSILGKVIRIGKIVKIKGKGKRDASIAIPILSKEVTHPLFPITSTQVSGAVQLNFKRIGAVKLNAREIASLDISCSYIGFLTEMNELIDKNFKRGRQLNIIRDMLILHPSYCPHELQTIETATIPLNDLSFYKYEWSFSVKWGEPLDYNIQLYARKVLKENVGHLFSNQDSILNKFVVLVYDIQKQNPQICYYHAFLTMHFIALLLQRNREYFSDLEIDSFIISAFLHQIGGSMETGSYKDLAHTLLKMFSVDRHVEDKYFDCLIHNIDKWTLWYPCHRCRKIKKHQRFEEVVRMFSNKHYNNNNPIHRKYIINAVIFVSDQCHYLKDRNFMCSYLKQERNLQGFSEKFTSLARPDGRNQTAPVGDTVINLHRCSQFKVSSSVELAMLVRVPP